VIVAVVAVLRAAAARRQMMTAVRWRDNGGNVGIAAVVAAAGAVRLLRLRLLSQDVAASHHLIQACLFGLFVALFVFRKTVHGGWSAAATADTVVAATTTTGTGTSVVPRRRLLLLMLPGTGVAVRTARRVTRSVRSVETAKLVELLVLFVHFLLHLLIGSRHGLEAVLQVGNGLFVLNALTVHGLLQFGVFLLEFLVGATDAARALHRHVVGEDALLEEEFDNATLVVEAAEQTTGHFLVTEIAGIVGVFGKHLLQDVFGRIFGGSIGRWIRDHELGEIVGSQRLVANGADGTSVEVRVRAI